MKEIAVKFVNHNQPNTKETYIFKTWFDDLKINDLVVVDTAYGLAVAQVCGFTHDKNPKKFVVSKIDTDRYKQEKQIEEQEHKVGMLTNQIRREVEKKLTNKCDADINFINLLFAKLDAEKSILSVFKSEKYLAKLTETVQSNSQEPQF